MKDIYDLLLENDLKFFTYDEEHERIVYDHKSAPVVQISDFKRLVEVLDANGITHEDIGMDLVLIKKEGAD